MVFIGNRKQHVDKFTQCKIKRTVHWTQRKHI